MKKLSKIKAGEIITASGQILNILDPQPEDIKINDIINALSRISRFGGQISEFYSVAQHCLLVQQIAPKELALAALFHDAEEAYIGDMVRPIKNMIPEFSKIGANLRKAIWDKFNIDYSLYEQIKEYDDKALTKEFDFFYNNRGHIPLIRPDVVPNTYAYAINLIVKSEINTSTLISK